jgi:hypothetical protein
MAEHAGTISDWLLLRAAGLVRRLRLTTEHHFHMDFENPDAIPAADAAEDFLAILPHLNSNRQLIDLCIDCNTQLVCSFLPSFPWTAALRSLRRLHLYAGLGGFVTVGSLEGLGELVDLKIESSVLEMPEYACLPPSLERLDLACETFQQVRCWLCAGVICTAPNSLTWSAQQQSYGVDGPSWKASDRHWLALGLTCPWCLPPCHLQLAALTRLRSLRLDSEIKGESDRMLICLPALEHLEMPGYTLPDFLSEIKTLRSLTVAGTSKASIAGVERALRPPTQLTQLVLRYVHDVPPALAGLASLQRFALDLYDPTAGLQLPDGPWLANLRQLAAPAQVVADSPQVLAGATGLQELLLANFFYARTTAQTCILSWAGEHPTLRSLCLENRGDYCSEASFRAVVQALARNPTLTLHINRKLNLTEGFWEAPLFEPWQLFRK